MTKQQKLFAKQFSKKRLWHIEYDTILISGHILTSTIDIWARDAQTALKKWSKTHYYDHNPRIVNAYIFYKQKYIDQSLSCYLEWNEYINKLMELAKEAFND